MKTLLFASSMTILISMLSVQAKTHTLPKYDGLSGTPSTQKPSKALLCGTNSAWSMSCPTVTSIYGSIARGVGISEAETRVLRVKDPYAQQKLRETFGSNEVSCKLTVKPNGRIESVEIKKSSGFPETDRKILEFMKNAGPFKPNEFPESLSWTVEFPQFLIVPDY